MNIEYTIDNFSEEAMVKDRLGHRTGDWSDQVRKGVEDLIVSDILLKIIMVVNNISTKDVDVFEYNAGRKMPGASDYKRRDTVDFKVH